ncbi:alginate lyase family protein [Algoriphagus persicinus]|uniref:alginate lyase family protein n=1 Tax=Algoriphagus persicinus TaxID=3108754 RepID=UPI002B3F5CAF|nr:alginate lyase family protein [Algoriphagus sp. E1-3-M2]MEB2786959.1 alginate lyase family protein [Algoriphagus sp. E1-3-M2]
MDFLKQENISVDIKLQLSKDIYQWLWTGKLPLEPYPASLRIMNLLRFLNSNSIPKKESSELNKYLLAELNYLSKNLEYHLLANHLLENAFAWWMGVLYFKNQDWTKKAGKLLRVQLDEQILKDGAHYELAPMYHQIILFRMLEAYHLTPSTYVLKFVLREKAEIMLGWLQQMTFPDETLPHFNDTTEGISYSPKFLLETAGSIGLIPKCIEPKGSGYRVFEIGQLKVVADVEGIKPSYQPGHAHADTFSFVLYDQQTPVVVDPGISTYNISERRSWERSTLAHNTLTIDGKDSSQVWAGFRVAKRAKVTILSESKNRVEAAHDGYSPQIHKRVFQLTSTGFRVVDEVDNYNDRSTIECRLYLHPEIEPKQISENKILLTPTLEVSFEGDCKIGIDSFKYSVGFNRLVDSKYILINIKAGQLLTNFFTK